MSFSALAVGLVHKVEAWFPAQLLLSPWVGGRKQQNGNLQRNDQVGSLPSEGSDWSKSLQQCPGTIYKYPGENAFNSLLKPWCRRNRNSSGLGLRQPRGKRLWRPGQMGAWASSLSSPFWGAHRRRGGGCSLLCCFRDQWEALSFTNL